MCDGGDHHLDADQQVLDLDGRALVNQVEAAHRLPSSKNKRIMSCHIMSFYYSDMCIEYVNKEVYMRMLTCIAMPCQKVMNTTPLIHRNLGHGSHQARSFSVPIIHT